MTDDCLLRAVGPPRTRTFFKFLSCSAIEFLYGPAISSFTGLVYLEVLEDATSSSTFFFSLDELNRLELLLS